MSQVDVGGLVYHAEKNNLDHIVLEICDDKLETDESVNKWSDIITDTINSLTIAA